MHAKVRADSPQSVIFACAGIPFVRGEWTEVPPGREAEAVANPYLEIRRDADAKQETPRAELEEPADNLNISEAALSLAQEHGIDLAQIEGSGSNGRILVSDVRAAIAPHGEESGDEI